MIKIRENKNVVSANAGLNPEVHYHVTSFGRGRGNYHVAPPLNDKGRDYDPCWNTKYPTAEAALRVAQMHNKYLAASKN